MSARNSHCSWCGHAFEDAQPWPRQCRGCAQISYLNPLPVGVALIPVDGGLLVIERGIEPRLGQRALPGGFIDLNESWQAACVREVFEETGIALDPAAITLFDVHSAPDGTVLVFGLAPGLKEADLPPFEATDETRARVILRQPAPLAFPLHTRVAQAWFDRQAGR